jgi:hypothetical protein
MKKFLLLAVITTSLMINVCGQNWYVAAPSGLSIREKPDAKAAVIGKIPYGTKITVTYPEEIVNITTEGIVGAWAASAYAGKTGYIVNSYLFPFPPPKKTVKTMIDYLLQLAPVFGAKLAVKSGTMNNIEEGGWELHKQLYKNGAEWHRHIAYEYDSDTYFIPGFTIEQGFLLLRMIPEFKDIFGEKDEFPAESKIIKKGEVEYDIKVEKETIGQSTFIKKIRVEYAQGAYVLFEMFLLDNQLVIFMGSGV